MQRIQPRAEVLEREAQAATAQAAGQLRHGLGVTGRDVLGDLHADLAGLELDGTQLLIQPVQQRRVDGAGFRQAHEQAAGPRAGREFRRGTDHPAIDLPDQVIAVRGGMNSEGRTSLPCGSTMRSNRSNILLSVPVRLAMGCCTSRKRFSASAAWMCLTQTTS